MKQESTSPNTTRQKPRVLVSGASFAGLSTAFWMNKLGYQVTVVEVGEKLKTGGTPVDIREGTVDIVKRMGLFEQIYANRLPLRPMKLVNSDGTTAATIPARGADEQTGECEIERDTLLRILHEAIAENVELIFADKIAHITEAADEIVVSFLSGRQGAYSFVFGCDGNHSGLRRMCFGEEALYSVSLQVYFSISIVNKLLIEENTSQMFNTPGKALMMSAYNHKTDITFCFYSEDEIQYDYRDQEQQRQIIVKQFSGSDWRTQELLDEQGSCRDFYFDKMSQIKMPGWSQGRVALVGDSAYCASPAAGMGGSLAIVGAAALGEAFQKHPGNHEAAFREYYDSLLPFIEDVQRQAVEFGLKTFMPRSEEDIRNRNAQFNHN